uniref:Uncharacterized protein n=1 Tax=Hanusia phi TaxID=3032 RepID=A0A7S0HRZ3_9CRYP|mmetsp:Transcript_30064/g.68027  ORF Transcript_30064/g.68027 Transcript_30064/m.68027 type:complete len:2514 (+) Transcript_30064:91-7632(+)
MSAEFVYIDAGKKTNEGQNFLSFFHFGNGKGAERAVVKKPSNKGLAEQPPPDIVIRCIDEYDPVFVGEYVPQVQRRTEVLKITWNMSWSDVLDLLKFTFGRAAIFQYEINKIPRIVTDENDFDQFCNFAESQDDIIEVRIVSALYKPSEWIATPAGSLPPMLDVMTNTVISLPLPAGEVDEATTEDIQEEDIPMESYTDEKRMLPSFSFFQNHPKKIEHLLIFGFGGFLLCSAVIVICYWKQIDTIAATTLALPFNLFFSAFLVRQMEEGFAPIFKLGIAFFGFWASLAVVILLSFAQQLTQIVGVALWTISTFWYLEVITDALGWPGWLTGFVMFSRWVSGGCVIFAAPIPEPIEPITIVGKEPDSQAFNARELMHLAGLARERQENVKWRKLDRYLKDQQVVHVCQCLNTLSHKSMWEGAMGNPVGPLGLGIIDKKWARQLLKWLTRKGNFSQAMMERKSKLGVGKVMTVFGGESAGIIQVQWENEVNQVYAGKKGIYEVLLYEVPVAEEYKFTDGVDMNVNSRFIFKFFTFVRLFLPKFLGWVLIWAIFFGYYGMLYVFEYSITSYSVYQAMASSHAMPGRLYSAAPGNKLWLHIYCKGFTNSNGSIPDKRNVVIIESMESLGMSVAMARLQDSIAQYGICCVYDRIGYGWSTSVEIYEEVRTNRTPSVIASELHYALRYGLDPDFKRPLFFYRTVVDQQNQSVLIESPINPPYILLGYGAGGLYTRQFAHDYPNDTAGLLLVDALPAIGNDENVTSSVQKHLTPFELMMCHRFLQPIGFVYNFLPAYVTGIFRSQTSKRLNGNAGGANDYDIMVSFMYSRPWCPTVIAEYDGIFKLGGIKSVAEADRSGYDVPTVVWAREDDSLLGLKSTSRIYDYNVSKLPAGGLRRSTANTTAATSSCTGEDCVSWFDVQTDLVGLSSKPWVNPFNGKVQIMRGDPQSCATLGCSTFTPMENPGEISDAVLDLWLMLGFSDKFPSNLWYFELGGQASTFTASAFRTDLAALVSHVLASNIEIVDGPTEGLASESFWSSITTRRSLRGRTGEDTSRANHLNSLGRESKQETTSRLRAEQNWYSGIDSPYVPILNDGAYRVTIIMYGHKPRATGWAEDILRGSEDQTLDTTATARRSAFARKWRLLSIHEKACDVNIITNNRTCTFKAVDIFTSLYISPLYSCPQNTYRQDQSCKTCDLSSTSATGSTSVLDCKACQPYFHLSSDGKSCERCPPNTISNVGALTLSECFPTSLWSVRMDGPIDSLPLLQPAYPQASTRKTFNSTSFLLLISNISSIPLDLVALESVGYVDSFTDSRYQQGRGPSVFQVRFAFLSKDKSASDIAKAALLGQECSSPSPTCALVDANYTRRALRDQLFAEFPVVSVKATEIIGGSTNQPSYKDIFADIFSSSYLSSNFRCPASYYRDSSQCLSCPDMSTSDAGATKVDDCRGFPTLVLSMKDVSVTYQARTRSLDFGGMQDAQPYALSLMNYTGLAQSAPLFLKTRGYALHPYQYVNPSFPSLGLQTIRCQEGSNCFNASQFRIDVSSAINGLVDANKIRLLPPSNCDLLSSGVVDPLCGPWPGIARNDRMRECVCAGVACYMTLGAPMVAEQVGFRMQTVSKAANAADCARLCSSAASGAASNAAYCNSFLYSPSSWQCDLRYLRSYPTLGNFCPSTSPACRSLVLSLYEDLDRPFPSLDGVQMYWLAPDPQLCTIITQKSRACSNSSALPNRVFDVDVDAVVGGAGGTGLRSPLDNFHVIVRFHAETATLLGKVLDILLARGAQSVYARPGALDAFLLKYQVVQVYSSEQKSLVGGRSAEGSLLDSGYVDCKDKTCGPVTLSSSAWCNDTIAPLNKTNCGGTAGVKPVCQHIWDGKAWVQVIVCSNGLLPTCQVSGSPVCSAVNLFDRNSSTFWPAVKSDGVVTDFVTVTFTQPGGSVSFVELTRVDLQERGEVATGLADSFGELQLDFSDGSSQKVRLAGYGTGVGVTSAVQTFYIRPVVTSSITIRVAPLPYLEGLRNPQQRLGLASADFYGQPLDAVSNVTAVDFLRSSYSTAKCPPNTFVNASLKFCQLCPFPLVSPAASSSLANCSCPTCSDGRVHWQADEKCDDGNQIDGDGCDHTCLIEPLHICYGPLTATKFGNPIASYSTPDKCIRIGSEWTNFGEAPWPARFGAAAVFHSNALRLTGGMGSQLKSAYSSTYYEYTDGSLCTVQEPADSCALARGSSYLSWSLAPGDAINWSPRAFHGLVSFKGFMWLTGGINRTQGSSSWVEGGSFNDVWKSLGSAETQGSAFVVPWLPVTAAASWVPRGRHASLVFAGSMWILGGERRDRSSTAGAGVLNYQTEYRNDVWRSEDGAQWLLVTEKSNWQARAGHTAVVHTGLNEIFVMGGRDAVQYYNDIWRSGDGKDWTLVTQSALWSRRWLHASVFFENSLWIIGGHFCMTRNQTCTTEEQGTFYNDVYLSADGRNWLVSTSSAGWKARAGHAAVVFVGAVQSDLWILGGYHGFQEALNDTWRAFKF